MKICVLIQGNEGADDLAKIGASLPQIDIPVAQ